MGEKTEITRKIWILSFSIIFLIGMSIDLSILNSDQAFLDTSSEKSGIVPKISQYNPNEFVSVWDTRAIAAYPIDSSESDQILLPLTSEGEYNFTIDWGDGNIESITSWNQGIHTYTTEGVYTIEINGTIIGWRFNSRGDIWKLLSINQWGCLRLGNTGGYFSGCLNLEILASDALNLTGTTNMNHFFGGCNNLGDNDSMKNWDTSNVTSMVFMFYHSPCNQNITKWDVSSVTNMQGMFWGCRTFNQPIGRWNVSKVTNMYGMFSGVRSFNQYIGNWDVSSVTDMSEMFDSTWNPSGFDQPLGKWNISKVTTMNKMFCETKLSTENYDDILVGWSSLLVQNGVVFDAGYSKYSRHATDARNILVVDNEWTIIDGGKAPFILGIIAIVAGAMGLVGFGIIILWNKRKMK